MAAGMKQVGQLYEDGEFFLPQLVMAGATMKHGMAVLEPLLQEARQTAARARWCSARCRAIYTISARTWSG